MAKLSSFLLASGIGAICAASALASCTASTGDDDDDGGAGGDGPSDAGAPSGGTSGSGATGGGGTSGAGGAPAEGGAPDGVGPGGAGPGAGGAGNVNVCEGAAGAGGATAAEGLTCTDYCSDFFTNCPDSADDATFTDEADCLAVCMNFGNEQLCCRASYALAATGAQAANACAAAAGVTTCN